MDVFLSSKKQGCSRLLWLRPFHYAIGEFMVGLVLDILYIGLVGAFGYYEDLGYSLHSIKSKLLWVRLLHIGTNVVLSFGFLTVELTG